MKVFAYLRVSGRSQIDGDGFDRQRAAIEAWACLNGAVVVQEFIEEGVTGDADGPDRPAFAEMLGALMSNGVKTVVVENLTRLARSFTIQDSVITFLASRGYDLISADNGENISEAMKGDPVKRALIQMLAVFAEYEKNALVLKLRAARVRKRAAGNRVEGRKPFGFRKGEDETIKRMIEMREMGWGYHTIASALDEEGRPTRDGLRKKGKTWKGETVRRILERVKKEKMEVAK